MEKKKKQKKNITRIIEGRGLSHRHMYVTVVCQHSIVPWGV